jgi:type II secretory pathway pseudopilin PulG
MGMSKHGARGFTLIAALLLMVLLSAMAVGLMFLVTNEGHASANEQEANVAFNGAESGIEKLTADLGSLYNSSLAPTPGQIQNLINFPPSGLGVNYTEAITYATDANGNPLSNWHPVSAGSNQGLYAEIVPMTLTVNATRPTGASVNMTRNVEVALIPVFQFGVFCGYDCSYFPGPDFSFGGRVHTNGNLFLADGSRLVFNDKIAAFTQVIMDQLENGHPTSSGYGGTVYTSTAAGGCPLNTFPPPTGGGTNCVALPASTPSVPGDASWSGGYPGLAGSANSNFPNISGGTLKGYVTNGVTGATNMQLPFVQNSCTSNPPPCTDPIQIIRKPLAGESNLSSVGQSRVYNKAQIRVLLADTEADLRPGQLDPANDVQFVPGTGSPNAMAAGFAYNKNGTPSTLTQYFGVANAAADANWKTPINPASVTGATYKWSSWPLLGELTTVPPPPDANNAPGGQGAWLRVEYLNAADKWIPITREWLQYGFGRAYNAIPTVPGPTALVAPLAGQNGINPHALLILQQLSPTAANNANTTGAASQNAWYPINFYDAREGEQRDTASIGCTANGIMNAVEIDLGNLGQWLSGTGAYAGGSGKLVNYADQNGYLLYFSDRRGMLPNPNQGNVTSGESGLEDVVNSGIAAGTPDGQMEAKSYYTYSPEDVDQNGQLDNWGGANIGYGFQQNTFSVPPNPYLGVSCSTTGLANAVTGARHVLKLVDGGMDGTGHSYLPMRWDTPTPSGGFTVASENSVYVQGNYNSGSADPYWSSNFTNSATPHAAAAIIADSVTVLSNQWNDLNSLLNPANPGSRSTPTQDTYYRMAVAGGKNIPFPAPSWGSQDMGTDGGLHNFLRYLEAWGNVSLHYNGSLVSMYYSEYNTGIFKCCTTVYSPPRRDYHFDVLFLNPSNLPPGTPMFQDIVNLSYRQNFQPQ